MDVDHTTIQFITLLTSDRNIESSELAINRNRAIKQKYFDAAALEA